jgi:hypothetical protein
MVTDSAFRATTRSRQLPTHPIYALRDSLMRAIAADAASLINSHLLCCARARAVLAVGTPTRPNASQMCMAA